MSGDGRIHERFLDLAFSAGASTGPR
jgi:hypothetical protein